MLGKGGTLIRRETGSRDSGTAQTQAWSGYCEHHEVGRSLLGGRTTKPFWGDLKTRLGFGICPDSTEEPLNTFEQERVCGKMVT